MRSAFARLIDYAGLFPPAQLGMRAALEEYVAARRSADSWILGRFLCPASRLRDLFAALPAGENIELGVIVDPRPGSAWLSEVQACLESATAAMRANAAGTVSVLEVAAPRPRAMRETFDAPVGQFGMVRHAAGLGEVPAFVEIPRFERWAELLPGALSALRRARLGAKLRCGGQGEDALPTADEVAHFIAATAAEGVSFKLTAGLHHPIRGVDASGVLMHGFLNILAATALHLAGSLQTVELAEVVGDEEAANFTLDERGLCWRDRIASAGAVEETRRRLFTAYGSCSFREPVDDLRALGMLEDQPSAAPS